MRKILIGAALALTLAMAGCSANTVTSYDALPMVCGTLADNSTVSKVQSVGAFDTKPTVTFPAPLSSKTIAKHVLINGTGLKFHGDQMVKFEYSAFNATTGASFATTKYDGSDAVTQQFGPKQEINFCKALSGLREGSRVAFIIPAKIAHQNKGDAASKIGPNDDLIFVIDMVKVYYPKSIGEYAPQQSGVPTIIRTATGQPSVQIPHTTPPTTTKLYTTIKSSNPQAVAMGDNVTLQYSGFLWNNGTEFDSSWSTGPVQWPLTGSGFIKGFIKALTQSRDGKPPHVGDEILAVVTPGDGYGSQGNTSIPTNSTLVFVIDILGTEKASK